MALRITAIIFWITTFIWFHFNSQGGIWPWSLLLTSVLLFPLSYPSVKTTPNNAISKNELIAVALVTLVAIVFRFYQLNVLPYGIWFDESENTIVIKRMLANFSSWPIYTGDLSQLPTFSLLWQLPFVWLFPEGVHGVRIAAACAGVTAVFCIWLAGRELFGSTVGILAAALLAISRWHLSFTRLGMVQILTTVMAPLILYSLARAYERKDKRAGAFAGVLLGLGCQTYFSLVIMPVIAGLYFLWRSFFTPLPKRWGIAVLVFITAVAAYLPLADYAQSHSEEFSKRFSTVSEGGITSLVNYLKNPTPENKANLEPVYNSLKAHLLMFHVAGDRNGRHNIPGEPMLDPVVGIFFLLGMVCLLSNLKKASSIIILAAFFLTLTAGILSLPFEAPQAARTVANSCFTTLIAALGFSVVIKFLKKERIKVGVTFVFLVTLGVYTWHKFFNLQMIDPRVWGEYGAAPTRIAELTHLLEPSSLLIVPESLSGGPTLELLKSEAIPLRSLESAKDIPVPCNTKSAVFVFEADGNEWKQLLKTLYPGANAVDFKAPGGNTSLLSEIHLSKEEINSICISETQFKNLGQGFVRFSDSPLNKVEGTQFLKINELQGFQKESLTIQDLYKPDIKFGGLLTKVLPITDIKLAATKSFISPLIFTYFHKFNWEIPSRLEWTGILNIENDSEKEFLIKGRDGFSFSLDGKEVFSTPEAGEMRAIVNLTKGQHPVKITLDFVTGYFQIYWLWKEPKVPGSEFEVVPSWVLKPAI